ncbi:MAG: response regulator [Lachnospiraceae bacterium]|nr:response regulator [Lachnospiraceae bacterium]
MRILAVDDERLMLNALENAIKEAVPDAELCSFRKGSEALNFAKENLIDIAFLDIRMRGMDGLELARELLALYPKLNVIFCTGYDDYISEAFREVRCNGYIMKPVDADQVREEMKHLRMPFEVRDKKKIRFQCFGYFEVFVNDQPIDFARAKTKELLAYLVSACGAVCSNQEIMVYLWEDDENHESYFKKIRTDLIETLEKYGCEDILYRQRAGMGICGKMVECDYYDWKKTNNGRYNGEFMKQYSWSEYFGENL